MIRVGIVGLGYVGITLAVALAQRGIEVFGCDRERHVVESLAKGKPHLFEPGVEAALAECVGRTLHVMDELPAGPLDAVIICVSTPVDPATHAPMLENLRAAARSVAATTASGTLVVVRSTVPVGATRAIVLPELSARHALVRLAFAPERTIQGQALRELQALPQVVGGLDDASRDAAAALFGRLTARVVPVSSLEAAELVKLVNNCHTDLIYSFGNEVALLAERWRLDPLEVIKAANVDYPRPDLARPGFVGGGCLTKDPYILLDSARAVGHDPWLVDRARQLNEHLPAHVANRFVTLVREARGTLDKARVALLGFAYKGWPPTDDMRGAPSLSILDVLRAAGLEVCGHDYLVAPEVLARYGVPACSPEEAFRDRDGVLVITNHPDYGKLDLPPLLASLRKPAVVFDCWRILDEGAVRNAGAVRYAGIGYG
jgi:UDP-N-acetyl-D-mannosaminuronic acid dehydrogenase